MAWVWQQVAVNAVSKSLNDRAGSAGRLKGKKAKQQQLVMQTQQQQQSAATAAVMQLSPASSSPTTTNATVKEVKDRDRRCFPFLHVGCCRFYVALV